MTLVSIIVPAYNVAEHLSRCLDSLLAQSEELLEIIVVNDGSTDETPLLADRYSEADPRVRVIHQVNSGVSSARNAGLAASKGKYVCFVDSDDWVEPTMVESMLFWCDSTEAVVAVAGAYVDFHDEKDNFIRSNLRVLPRIDIRRGEPLPARVVDEKIINLLGYPWNKMYRRDWLVGLNEWFNPSLYLFEDMDFNCRILSRAEYIVLVPQAFVHYVQRPDQSLGAFHGSNLLALHSRAIRSVDSLLRKWNVDEEARRTRRTRASAMALWSGLIAAAATPNPPEKLAHLVEFPGAADLVALSVSWRDSGWRGWWATLTLRRRWYRIALFPVRLRQVLSRLFLTRF